MEVSAMVKLAVTGLMVASVPLTMVWMSSDANKFRKLAWTIAFLTFDLIVFGAFTRLTDSGLGCPDWPGCFGAANPFIAHAQISAAEALLPSGPVTIAKAWIEMIHRFLAMGIGLLIGALMFTAWIQWVKRRDQAFYPVLTTVLFLFVGLQGAFGAWTVTLKLQPVIVTTHLLLGMGLLAMVSWLAMKASDPAPVARPAGTLRRLAIASAIVLALQIALGGWVSTNYATLACSDFPMCRGELDFQHGFTLWRELGKTAAGHYLPFAALTAIHWVHRNFALVVVTVLGWTAWRASSDATLRPLARAMGALLVLQASTGIATVYLDFPLAIAVLHNAGAALLVLLVTMLNYKTKYQARPHQ